MQVRCIAPFGDMKPGDLADVPDGSTVCPLWFEPVAAPDGGASASPVTPPVSS